MIDDEFNIKLKEKYSPEGSELRNLQERLFRILVYFDEFCQTNGIKYWLASGTCLGAIRHGGFIPWDDDLDIEMLKEDYQKLVSLRKSFDNDLFVLHDYKADNEYISPYAKIRDINSFVKETHNRDKYLKYKGAFIDVFVREINSSTSNKISHVSQYISYSITNIPNKTFRIISKFLIYNSLHMILFPTLRVLDSIFVGKRYLSHCLGTGFYKKIDSKGLFPLKSVKFEGRQFPVPGNVDDYLKRLYGDYMKLPEKAGDFRVHFNSIKLNLLEDAGCNGSDSDKE